MYPSGIGTSFHDPLTTNFRKSQSLAFTSGRPLLKDYKRESGHVHPLLGDATGSSIRQGRGIQYTNGVVSFDGTSRPQTTAGSQRAGTAPIAGHAFPTSVGSPGGTRRSFEGFAGATWGSRPNTAYSSFGRRYTNDLMTRSRPTTGVPNNPPKWLSLDKQMLSFEAFFKEAVEESPVETYRVRRCVIQYFLEDDSIKISEPREENSGMPQGAFLKRHRVAKGDGSFYTWADLNVGIDLPVYGRVFRITDCDSRTREFYRLKGIEVNGSEELPEDPYAASSRPATSNMAREVKRDEDGRRMVDDYKGFMEARLGKCMDDKEVIAQFLRNDRKVLRFFASWDDRGQGGDLEQRRFRLHYFLADDTVEVLEANTPNNGRDPWPAMLKRMKLPKVWSANSRDNRYFYKASDFRVGDTISVFGRKLLIYDCDNFTREWYKKEYGVEFKSIPLATQKKPQIQMVIPPHNGIGREEDSIMNVLFPLHEKPPRQNVMRRLQNKSKMLRFVAKLDNAVGFDQERVFTVNYHLDTDDISVFEPPVHNSGRTGGRFMDKHKIKKPGSAEYYSESDMYIGARLHCFGRIFVLMDTDLYTLNYMASHPDVFPHANPELIKSKLAKLGGEVLERLEATFRPMDAMATGCVNRDEFREALASALPVLNTQEIMTLQRSFETLEGGNVSYAELIHSIASNGETTDFNQTHPGDNDFENAIGAIRRQLQKRGPSGVRGLARAFAHIDEAGDRLVGRRTLAEVFLRTGFSLPQNHIEAIFEVLQAGGDGVVDYAAILDSVCGELSSLREQMCLRAFAKVDKNQAGSVSLDEIFARFDSSRHPAVLAGEITVEDARAEHVDCFEGAGHATEDMLGQAEFLRVYSEISVAFEDDTAFLDYMANVWDIQPVVQNRRSWR